MCDKIDEGLTPLVICHISPKCRQRLSSVVSNVDEMLSKIIRMKEPVSQRDPFNPKTTMTIALPVMSCLSFEFYQMMNFNKNYTIDGIFRNTLGEKYPDHSYKVDASERRSLSIADLPWVSHIYHTIANSRLICAESFFSLPVAVVLFLDASEAAEFQFQVLNMSAEIFNFISSCLGQSYDPNEFSLATKCVAISFDSAFQFSALPPTFDSIKAQEIEVISADSIELDLERLFERFFVHDLFPKFLDHIARLNLQTSGYRRSLTTRLFSASKKFFTNPIMMDPSSSFESSDHLSLLGAAKRPLTSPEYMMKRLADYAFMLGLHDLAVVCYDSVKKDFNLPKSSVLYLSSMEMNLLSEIIQGAEVEEDDRTFETLQSNFLSFQTPQSLLKWYLIYSRHLIYLLQRNFLVDAISTILRVSNDPICPLVVSAVTAEMAAVLFLSSFNAPMYRKSAYYYAIATKRFVLAKIQNGHPERTRKLARELCLGGGWSMPNKWFAF